MSITLRTNFQPEAVVTDDGSLNLFYAVAAMLERDLKAKFTQKADDFDSQEWEFRYKGHSLALNYSIYNGISISSTRLDQPGKDEKIVSEIADQMRVKLSTISFAKKIA